MTPLEIVAEADRQFTVCNACRYCEGFCAVFGAAELRASLEQHDVAYLANLCHDCRMCYDACPFTPPHEYAVNIPQILAEARADSYAQYATPSALGALFRAPRRTALGAVGLGVAGALAATFATSGASGVVTAHIGPGAFYAVLPYLAMVIPAVTVALGVLLAFVLGARRYAQELRGDGPAFMRGKPLAKALHEAFALVYLRGGGGGCYEDERGSGRRRLFHMFVFWGFCADFASTISAAIMQEFLGLLPPYPIISVPVVLGTIGGLALAFGAAGLLWLKRIVDPAPQAERMVALDVAFLSLLLATALSGLAVLSFRETAALGLLLALHLGTLAGLALTAPYGKFVHFIYRLIALAKHAAEQSQLNSTSQ
jgi:citrate/tricarballylate utilization protein